MAVAPALKKAEAAGRGGDTMLVHINAEEAAFLKKIGGSGTVNPKTGLKEFYTESRDRQDTVGGSHDARSSAGAGATSDRRGAGQRSGLVATGETTPYGAPVKVNKAGMKTALPEKATLGKPAQSWHDWQNQVETYNKAATEWNLGAQKHSLANLVNNVAPWGFSMQAPDLNKPKTFVDGTYHLGVNPAELAASAASIMGSGLITGPVAGKLYEEAGLPNVMLSGGPLPGGWDPKGATPPSSPASPSTPSQTPEMAGGTGTGGVPTLGQSMQPQPQAQAAAPTPAPGLQTAMTPYQQTPGLPPDMAALLQQIMGQGGKPPAFGQMVAGA